MKKRTAFKVANCNLEETHVNAIDSVIECIFVMRKHRVMLDHDLAERYGVTTKRLNQQFNRNRNRFPADFAFRLTLNEAKQLFSSRSQIATLKKGQNIKHPPHVFTEHGAIMLACVLNSAIAVQASVHVVRAFVQARAALMEYAHLTLRIDKLEEGYDDSFRKVFAAIRHLIASPVKPPRQIGFVAVQREHRNKRTR